MSRGMAIRHHTPGVRIGDVWMTPANHILWVRPTSPHFPTSTPYKYVKGTVYVHTQDIAL